MRTHHAVPVLAMLALSGIVTSCDAVDRARSRFATADTVSVLTMTGSGLVLGLQPPGTLRAGDEGVVRISVSNRADTTARNIRLELIVPGWAEPMPPRVGDREVTMAALSDGGTRLAYRMEETPLEPGQTQSVEQRIRVPAAGAASATDVPDARAVRARLLGADGEPLAEVHGEIGVDAGAQSGSPVTVVPPDQMGPVRLGMTRQALRQAVPTARDTTWTEQGESHDGAWVPLGSNAVAFAMLSGDSVVQLEMRDAAVRTRERLGVGSSLDELRAAYGAACADAAQGAVVVWFANAPGLVFALDTSAPANAAQLRASPDALPGSARVTRWWLRRGVACNPPGPGAPR